MDISTIIIVLMEIIILVVGLVVGLVIGKRLSDSIKWEDKKKALDSEWQLKIESLDKNYQGQMSDLRLKNQGLENDYKRTILELKNSNDSTVKKITHDWELKYSNDLAEIKIQIQEAEKYMRLDAVKRSKKTILGKTWEQVCPYFPEFPYLPSDMKFIGSPVDFIVFDGASEKNIQKVVFLEIKTGKSQLSGQEIKLRNAVKNGSVYYETYNIKSPEELEKQEYVGQTIEGTVTTARLYEFIDEKMADINLPEDEEDDDFGASGYFDDAGIKFECSSGGSTQSIEEKDDVRETGRLKTIQSNGVIDNRIIENEPIFTSIKSKTMDKADLLSREREKREH